MIIYKDRLETKNANRPHLYGQLTLSNYEPFPKNPHIVQMFAQMGRAEELGSGLRNIYKYSKAYTGNDNIQFDEKDIFLQTVPLDGIFEDIGQEMDGKSSEKFGEHVIENNTEKGTEKGSEKGTEKLNKNQKLIIQYFTENPFITSAELSELIGIRADKIRINLQKLKSRGIIERIGAAKGGYWKVIQ